MADNNMKLSPTRPFRAGEKVYDREKETWADIVEFPGKAGTGGKTMLDGDSVVVLSDGHRTWKQIADNIYKKVPGKLFKEHPVCYEHRESEDCHPYICPDLKTDCWENEIVLDLESDK